MQKAKFYLRSVYYIVMRWIVHKDYMTAYVPEHDLRFKFKTEDVVGRVLYKYRTFESGITRCFLDHIKLEDHDVVLDVGANIGWYSLVLGKHAPSSVSLYAFEPDPLNFQLLSDNVSVNQAQNITCVPKAVSDSSTTKTLYLYPSKNRGRHSLLPINEGEQVEVTTTTIDAFVEQQKIEVDRIKFMKIDVEGYEYFVLNGAHHVLSHIPYLHTEYSPGYMQKGGVDARTFIGLLRGYRLMPHRIDEKGDLDLLTDEQLLHLPKSMNLLWARKDLSAPSIAQ
jgi:FkbM family methyltransferase